MHNVNHIYVMPIANKDAHGGILNVSRIGKSFLEIKKIQVSIRARIQLFHYQCRMPY